MLQRAKGSRPSTDWCACYSSQYHGYYSSRQSECPGHCGCGSGALVCAYTKLHRCFLSQEQQSRMCTLMHYSHVDCCGVSGNDRATCRALATLAFNRATSSGQKQRQHRGRYGHDGHLYFAVQMPGETIIVPPNSPHAVIALNSSYLHGSIIRTPETGETVIVPPNSPHAVIALESSYLHGSVIDTTGVAYGTLHIGGMGF